MKEQEFKPVAGKIFPMWQGLAAQKEKFIGGLLIEHDPVLGEMRTDITDILMREEEDVNGEPYAMFSVKGDDFDMAANVKYAGISAVPDRPGAFSVAMTYGGGCSWDIIPKEAKIRVYAHTSPEALYEKAKEKGLSDEAANYFRYFNEVELELTVMEDTGKVVEAKLVKW